MKLIKVLAFIVVSTAFGGDIWGTGEVPRLTDPADVPRTLEEIWQGYEADYDKQNIRKKITVPVLGYVKNGRQRNEESDRKILDRKMGKPAERKG